MRKFVLFIVLAGAVGIAYSVFSDPDRREKAFRAIEGSTGVNLGEHSGEAIGRTAEKMFEELGDTLSDPRFRRSLERWGENALDKLDDIQLENLKKDLEKEAARGSGNFDGIFEKYFGKTGNS